jgi:hypothetical protein
MRMRWGIASVVVATLVQVAALTASASADFVKLSGRAISVTDGEPIGGMTIQLFAATTGQQDPAPKPIAETVTESNGKFQLSVLRETPFALVKIRVFPPPPLPCGGVALVNVAGAAQAYVARKELPTIAPKTFDPKVTPSSTRQLNDVLATFEVVGEIGTEDCVGSLGLYRTRDQE